MLIAIISDVHDNIPNLRKVMDYCRGHKVEKIICCGDLATLETLDFLNDNFSGEIFFTFGNMDQGHVADYTFEGNNYRNTKIFPELGSAVFDNLRTAFVHYPDVGRRLCETGKYDFVFHGHTHKPWTEVINNCTLLNPGNVANQHYPPTFATWNTSENNFSLIKINELK
jgi:putative phosphoesterase